MRERAGDTRDRQGTRDGKFESCLQHHPLDPDAPSTRPTVDSFPSRPQEAISSILVLASTFNTDYRSLRDPAHPPFGRLIWDFSFFRCSVSYLQPLERGIQPANIDDSSQTPTIFEPIQSPSRPNIWASYFGSETTAGGPFFSGTSEANCACRPSSLRSDIVSPENRPKNLMKVDKIIDNVNY